MLNVDRILSVALTTAAIAIAAVLIWREVKPRPVAFQGVVRTPPKFIPDWKEISKAGTRVGADSAPVTIIEFVDYECPFCKRFHEGALAQVRKQFGTDVAFVYIQFPIPSHRFASAAARAAECAGEAGRFGEFIDGLYAKQDSLGLKTWASFAFDAGIADTMRIQRCGTSNLPSPTIANGMAIGERIGVVGTPGIMVNGWLYAAPPSDTLLLQAVRAQLQGRRKAQG
jgi:protein-disulfide isomerase